MSEKSKEKERFAVIGTQNSSKSIFLPYLMGQLKPSPPTMGKKKKAESDE